VQYWSVGCRDRRKRWVAIRFIEWVAN
jgi:hypothetical protein